MTRLRRTRPRFPLETTGSKALDRPQNTYPVGDWSGEANRVCRTPPMTFPYEPACLPVEEEFDRSFRPTPRKLRRRGIQRVGQRRDDFAIQHRERSMRRSDRRTPLLHTEVAQSSGNRITLLARRLVSNFRDTEGNRGTVHVPSASVSRLQRVLCIHQRAASYRSNSHGLLHCRPLLLDLRDECGMHSPSSRGVGDREGRTVPFGRRVGLGELLCRRRRIQSSTEYPDRVLRPSRGADA